MSPGLLLRVALGALGSALVHGLLPAGDDAFRGTLVVLPLVVAGLVAVDREGRRRGGLPVDWRAPEVWPVLELGALGRWCSPPSAAATSASTAPRR